MTMCDLSVGALGSRFTGPLLPMSQSSFFSLIKFSDFPPSRKSVGFLSWSSCAAKSPSTSWENLAHYFSRSLVFLLLLLIDLISRHLCLQFGVLYFTHQSNSSGTVLSCHMLCNADSAFSHNLELLAEQKETRNKSCISGTSFSEIHFLVVVCQ